MNEPSWSQNSIDTQSRPEPRSPEVMPPNSTNSQSPLASYAKVMHQHTQRQIDALPTSPEPTSIKENHHPPHENNNNPDGASPMRQPKGCNQQEHDQLQRTCNT
ncbi:hypothetical protein CIHG_00932 [Coccidioides immitis H538.4]|uniref:Uncharacterized protein n=2 Tax=Coccidioides immitis TaxID=5501 RepID=A0A0J8RDA0_COCIT|nr:hypothetical protein CIRG_03349 [Coccidioides immitis RMSCC 2394]KMU83150.1 hypothetical protein CIHG_00932 [Coccidioides immitis H538.4]TPX23911.1 hypothetical protein DIZ76_013254 [Coccidioides immitis]